jgi:hypothetical protein
MALLPFLAGSRAHAGYVAAEIVCPDSLKWSSDDSPLFGFAIGGSAQFVAGPSRVADEDSQDFADGDYYTQSPFNRQSSMVARQGSGRTAPAGPTPRKGLTTLDLVFFTDPIAPRSPAFRMSDYGDTVCLYHPCSKRLFRPPRSVCC